MLLRSRGVPSVAEVFAFLAGALVGFGVMGLAAQDAVARMESLDHAPDRVLAGALHWLGEGAAVGAAALLAEIHGWEAWPLGSFAATSIYILARARNSPWSAPDAREANGAPPDGAARRSSARNHDGYGPPPWSSHRQRDVEQLIAR